MVEPKNAMSRIPCGLGYVAEMPLEIADDGGNLGKVRVCVEQCFRALNGLPLR